MGKYTVRNLTSRSVTLPISDTSKGQRTSIPPKGRGMVDESEMSDVIKAQIRNGILLLTGYDPGPPAQAPLAPPVRPVPVRRPEPVPEVVLVPEAVQGAVAESTEDVSAEPVAEAPVEEDVPPPKKKAAKRRRK